MRTGTLLPTSTMGGGVISNRTKELISALRKAGVLFAVVSGVGHSLRKAGFSRQITYLKNPGARTTTMIERIALLPPVDCYVCETGRCSKSISENEEKKEYIPASYKL